MTALLFAFTAGASPVQNTGARATPQTQGATPGGTGQRVTPSPAITGPRSGGAPSPAGRRRSRDAQGSTPVPAANGSVRVIGDGDGDGILDRAARSGDSATLPGVTTPHNSLGIPAGTPILVRLETAVDSGRARNGDVLRGVLASALGKLPNGAPVILTVVAAAPAGQVGSGGVLSLQVTSINGERVLSQIVTAEGKEGTKLLPDDAPARGTEAVFTPDETVSLPAA